MDPNHFNEPFVSNHQQFSKNHPQQTAIPCDNMHYLTSNYGDVHRTPAPPVRPPSTTMEVAGNTTAHFPPPLPNNAKRNPFYKTGLCNKFQRNGTCPYGDTCTFAHGVAELRKPNPNPNPNPNSGLCYSFIRTGFCHNGNTCPYSHQRPPQPGLAPKVPFYPQPSLMMNYAHPLTGVATVVVPMAIQKTPVAVNSMNMIPNPSTEMMNSSSNPSTKIKNGVKPSRLFKRGKKIATIYADWTD